MLKLSALTLLALLAFAANSVLCRLALVDAAIDPLSFTLLRLYTGALVLVFIVSVARRRRIQPGRVVHFGTWSSAVCLLVYALGFSWAYIQLGAATGALILFAAVQLTMLAWSAYQGRRFSWQERSGIVICCCGFVLLFIPDFQMPRFWSALLMTLAGMAWGAYSLRGIRTVRNGGGNDSMNNHSGRGSGNQPESLGREDPSLQSAGNFIRASILGCACLPLFFLYPFELSAYGALLAALSGGLASGLGYAVWYAVLPQLAALKAAVLQLSVPLLAGLGAWIFLSEALTLSFIISAALVALGLVLVLVPDVLKVFQLK